MSRRVRAGDYLRDVTTDGLGTTAARGTAVTLLGQWAGFLLHMSSTIVLARLLAPRDYGIVAGVLALTGLAELLKDLGLGAATIQRRKITAEQLNALFWVNAALGIVIAGVIALAAPLVADFYGEADTELVTVVLAVPFVFSGISVQHQALLSRTLQFRRLTVIDLESRAAGLTAAIGLAALGSGYWALVAGAVVTAIVRCLQLWWNCRWRPGRPRWAKDMRSLLTFGGWTSLFGVVNYASRNADNVLIGRYFGAAQLGFYSRAYQLLLLPIQQINGPLSRVALPTLSRLQDEPLRFCRYYQTALSGIAFVALPGIALMAVLADEIVSVLLGPRWSQAAPIFQVLAVAGAMQTLGHANGWLYQTTGRARAQALWGVASRALIIAAFVAGLPWGPYGVAVAYAVVTSALLVPGFALASMHTPVSLSHILTAAWRPAVTSVVTCAVAFLVRAPLAPKLSDAAVLVLTCAAAVIVYGFTVLAWPGARHQWLELAAIVRQAFGRHAR